MAGTFERTVIWLGRFVDSFVSVQQTLSLEDPFLRFILSTSRISGSLLVLVDNFTLIASLGFVKIDVEQWYNRSSRLWLYCIVMGLVRDWHELQRLLVVQKSESNCHVNARSRRIGDEETQYIAASISSLLAREKALSIDTLRNFCDLWIPLSSLGYVKLSPRTISLLGTVSSICGVIQAVDASSRLSPS